MRAPDPTRSSAPSRFDTPSLRSWRDGSGPFLILVICRSYLRVGEALVSSASKGLAAAGAAWPPSMISLAVIDLPYKALLASSSVSMDAPCNETPAKSPLLREYVSTSTCIDAAL